MRTYQYSQIAFTTLDEMGHAHILLDEMGVDKMIASIRTPLPGLEHPS